MNQTAANTDNALRIDGVLDGAPLCESCVEGDTHTKATTFLPLTHGPGVVGLCEECAEEYETL